MVCLELAFFFLFSLTYQIIIGQNGKGEIKLTINQLVPSIMVAKLTFECDPASGSCASGCFAYGVGFLCKVGHQGMSCLAGRHRVLEEG